LRSSDKGEEIKLSEVIFAVIDTETTGTEPKTDSVVQVGIAKKFMGSTRQSCYEVTVKPPIPIPPATSAVNHLTDKMVEHCKPLSFYEKDIVERVVGCTFVAHNAKFDSAFLPFLYGPWVCTMRMAQHLWMDKAESFSLQYLRYWLGLEIDTGPAHTALADVTVTFGVLVEEIKEYLKQGRPDDIDLFITFCNSPIMYTKIPFGNKHRNELISDVVKNDKQYLNWVLNKMDNLDEDLRASILKALRSE